MSDNFSPVLVQPVLSAPCLATPEMVSAGAVAILDELGQSLLGEDGRVIYGP